MANEPIKPFTRAKNVVRASQTGAAPGTASLPPAGHEQREVLKERADALEAQAAEDFKNVEAIDPDIMDVERELAQHFNELEVTNAQPGFVYKWVNFVSNGGICLRQATAPPERWQVVTGDMPEAPELLAAGGTRKLGDVLLLRMPRKRHEILEKHREEKALRQQGAHESNLRAMAEKNPKAVRVYGNDNMPSEVTKRLTNPSRAAINAMRGAEAAQAQFDQNLRKGTLAV